MHPAFASSGGRRLFLNECRSVARQHWLALGFPAALMLVALVAWHASLDLPLDVGGHILFQLASLPTMGAFFLWLAPWFVLRDLRPGDPYAPWRTLPVPASIVVGARLALLAACTVILPALLTWGFTRATLPVIALHQGLHVLLYQAIFLGIGAVLAFSCRSAWRIPGVIVGLLIGSAGFLFAMERLQAGNPMSHDDLLQVRVVNNVAWILLLLPVLLGVLGWLQWRRQWARLNFWKGALLVLLPWVSLVGIDLPLNPIAARGRHVAGPTPSDVRGWTGGTFFMRMWQYAGNYNGEAYRRRVVWTLEHDGAWLPEHPLPAEGFGRRSWVPGSWSLKGRAGSLPSRGRLVPEAFPLGLSGSCETGSPDLSWRTDDKAAEAEAIAIQRHTWNDPLRRKLMERALGGEGMNLKFLGRRHDDFESTWTVLPAKAKRQTVSLGCGVLQSKDPAVQALQKDAGIDMERILEEGPCPDFHLEASACMRVVEGADIIWRAPLATFDRAEVRLPDTRLRLHKEASPETRVGMVLDQRLVRGVVGSPIVSTDRISSIDQLYQCEWVVALVHPARREVFMLPVNGTRSGWANGIFEVRSFGFHPRPEQVKDLAPEWLADAEIILARIRLGERFWIDYEI